MDMKRHHVLAFCRSSENEEVDMRNIARGLNSNRRWFMKKALAATGGASAAASLLAADNDNRNGKLSKGDATMLRFAAAAEIVESDFWIQYNELGGIQDSEVAGGTGIPAYTAALQKL